MAQLDKFKNTAVTWDSDRDPQGFHVWLENMASLVRATEHGYHLEDMMDAKLKRPKVSQSVVPSFLLDDPDFALNNGSHGVSAAAIDDSGEEEVDNASFVSGQSGGNFSLGSHTTRYADLPEEARRLDSLLTMW